ncbi:MAG: hypothetical protein IJZ85_05385 [Lachnospiraceae bacterium]|nr:hypothetical protein [Lachnospiraceae bacterium]
MKENKLFKRILCFGISIVMVFTIALSPLPGDIFSGLIEGAVADAAGADLALSQSELAMGVSVVPGDQASQDSFMNRYVRTSGTNLNINYLWKKVSSTTKDVKGASDTVPVGTLSQSSSSKYWSAQYKWTLDDQAKSWLDKYTLKFEANLVANKHEHGCGGEDHWNNAYVTIRTKDWDLSTDYGYEDIGQILGKTSQQNTVEVKETISETWSNISLLTYTAKHFGGQTCGGPEVGGSVFYLVDDSSPRITDVYLSTDIDGNGRFGQHTSFGSSSSITGYVVLQFSEAVRLADNYAKTDALTLDLEARYGEKSGYAINSNYDLTATFVKLTDDNKMVFEFSIPATMEKGNTHVYITGIKNVQDFNQKWDLKLYKADGTEFPTSGLEATNRITDIAGNSLNWSASDKSTGTYYFDNVAPTLSSINMTGSMITPVSTQEITSWTGNSADLGHVFAGVGDSLGFQVYFSESIKNTNGIKAVLNIKDAAGNPIKLDVSRVSGNCITFKNFTVTEEMQCEGYILITGFEGAGNLSDLAGNKVATNMTGDLKVFPPQKINLDLDKPVISTTMSADDGVYMMTNEDIGGEYFSFPVVFKEDTSKNAAPYYSTINDKPVQFVIVTPNDAINFTYYMDNSQTAKAEEFESSGVTVSSVDGATRYQAEAKISDGLQYYLHIRLDPNNDYSDTVTKDDTNGVFFNGTIHFYVSDWAGNEGTNSFAVKHQVDMEAPSVSVDNNLQLSVDYEGGNAGVTANFSASDNYDLQEVSYQWQYRFMTDAAAGTWSEWTSIDQKTVNITTGLSEKYSGNNTYTFTFPPDSDFTNRVGEIKITVTAEDRLGRNAVVTSKTLAFNFSKPTGNYSVTGGTEAEPLTKPVVKIMEAESSIGESSIGEARTVMLIKLPGETAANTYYMYDPQRAVKYEEAAPTYYVADIFDPLYQFYEDSSKYKLLESGYGSWYKITIDLSTGVCTAADEVADAEWIDLAKKLFQTYGAWDVKFVTSPDFEVYYNNIVGGYEAFNFTPGTTAITTSNIYLANSAKFDIEFTAATNENGEDVKSALSGYSTSASPAMNTYPTLDNVALTIKVTNTSDSVETNVNKYGFKALDYTGSKIQLFYTGTKDGTEEVLLRTWDLAQSSDGVQTIVFSEDEIKTVDGWSDGFKTGWYTLRVTVKNLNDREFTDIYDETVANQFIEEIDLYIDITELDMSMEAYYKAYTYNKSVVVRDGGEDSLYNFNDATLADKEIILSLADVPSSWNQTTWLQFSRGQREDGMGSTVRENIQIRVRNATYDALGTTAESTALWVDGSGQTVYYYVPVLVKEVKEGAYGTASDISSTTQTGLKLPMLDGYNLLIYEIVSTNGTVKTYEVPVFVYGQAEEWDLDYTMTTHGQYVRSVTLSAAVPGDAGLDNSVFYYGPVFEKMEDDETVPDSYTLTNNVENQAFYLLDQNGNLSSRTLTLYDADGNVLDIDGVAPYAMNVNVDDYLKNWMYYFTISVRDLESAVSAKDITLTFDTDYSAVLLGLTGEARANNTQQVTMSLPLAVDENGEYLMNADGTYAVWEKYEVGHNGVFRTQIVEESVDEETGVGTLELRVWMVTQADEDSADFDTQWTMMVTAPDVYGNETTETVDLERGMSPYLGTGAVIEGSDSGYFGCEECGYGLTSDGTVGIWCGAPLASLTGYGAGEQKFVFSGNDQPLWYTTAPMIFQDGTYQLEAVDLFGVVRDLSVDVYDFGEQGVSVTFSTTDPTNQPVTVMAEATGTVETITSIVSDTGVTGTIDPADPSKANITVEDNCTITITTSAKNEDGSFVQRMVKVTNIDKKVDDTYFALYDYRYQQLTGTETEVEGDVTVYLMCDTETVYTTNGPDTYTFPAGSKKGDSYTFEYVDRAGNVGTNTVVLSFDIVPIPPAPDKEAPDITLNVYGVRNNKSDYLIDLFNPVDTYAADEDGKPVLKADGTLDVTEAGAPQITNLLGEYKAQQYRVVLSITDGSDTKVIVQPAGTAAPVDYSAAATGSTVDFVTVSATSKKATLTISENGTFDLYVIDANNNISAITGIVISGIDKTAPVLYADYEVGTNQETGLPMVTATFLPENKDEQFDLIIPISQMLSKIVQLENGEYEYGYDENGDWGEIPVLQDVIRYYTLFDNNGEFAFNYRDEYGNLGQAVAAVKGMDTSAAIVKSVIWYGTVGNVLPEVMKASALVVNRDITAELNMSKPISDVKLYVYSADAENNAGALISADAPVEVSFTGTNIYITYTDNVNYQIVVEYTASASGRKGYQTLPAVECIDKTAPVITLVGGPDLAENKRSAKLTFTSNEDALLSVEAEDGYTTEFTWTATSNAETELYFTDKAGNRTVLTVSDLGIDEEMLEVWYSTTADGADATEDPLEGLTLDPGDTFYVKVSKAAAAVLSGEAKGDVEADTWTALTLSDESGLQIAQFTDKNTGDVVYGIVAAAPKDNIAPIIELATSTVVVDEGVSAGEMLAAICTGVTVTDDKDGVIDFTVTGYPDESIAGLYALEYKAVDEAGNSVVAFRNLYIMAEGTPILWINDDPGLPYGKVVIKDGENITLRLENLMDGEPVIIKYQEGIKTTGQMKYYSTTVEDMSFSVTEPGHYTIYVRSQGRVEYVTYIYVEDK